MNLQPGCNTVEFESAGLASCTHATSSALLKSGAFLGTDASIIAHIFLWTPNTRIVVSDVDGTITRSDVWGHVAYMIGTDWTHDGVARLFTAIKVCIARKLALSVTRTRVQDNGYEIVYLTARALGQCESTKDYLTHVRQLDGSLPLGPVITSPDR